jgi:hypothetical protein
MHYCIKESSSFQWSSKKCPLNKDEDETLEKGLPQGILIIHPYQHLMSVFILWFSPPHRVKH